jgi:methionine salvage enolase-phosphatase E1
MFFCSDHPGEIAAAREAGLTALLVDRGAAPQHQGPDGAGGLVVGSFESPGQLV